jgi:hypothetical protein
MGTLRKRVRRKDGRPGQGRRIGSSDTSICVNFIRSLRRDADARGVWVQWFAISSPMGAVVLVVGLAIADYWTAAAGAAIALASAWKFAEKRRKRRP